jgi:hypothetical protein
MQEHFLPSPDDQDEVYVGLGEVDGSERVVGHRFESFLSNSDPGDESDAA